MPSSAEYTAKSINEKVKERVDHFRNVFHSDSSLSLKCLLNYYIKNMKAKVNPTASVIVSIGSTILPNF
jgi:hypothetical protein